MDVVLLAFWSSHNRGLQNVQESEELYHHQGSAKEVHLAAAAAGVPSSLLACYPGLLGQLYASHYSDPESIQCKYGVQSISKSLTFNCHSTL